MRFRYINTGCFCTDAVFGASGCLAANTRRSPAASTISARIRKTALTRLLTAANDR